MVLIADFCTYRRENNGSKQSYPEQKAEEKNSEKNDKTLVSYDTTCIIGVYKEELTKIFEDMVA